MRLICGEMHYPRVPRAYWRDRLRMARAMGLNAISTYVFWNRHEPRPKTFDFTGENDVAAYLRTAQEEGLLVVLRPGPYVCAEWDFGGLPAWLLRDETQAIRTTAEAFMAPVRRWLKRLGAEVATLQKTRGGPIIAVQLENEYGAFGSDASYLRGLKDALTDAGFSEPLFTIDQPGDLLAGSLPEVPIAVTFAPGDPAHIFDRLREVRAGAPLLVGEYWAGWFDHWGEPHARRDDAQQAAELAWMLEQGASVNIYMFHGGTNFGFWNGANSRDGHPYEPTTTSYDYDAALDEAGRPTRKYHAFREAIARVTGVDAPSVPLAPQLIQISEFELAECARLNDALGACVESDAPLPMEAIDQSFGFTLYRTTIDGPVDAILCIEDVCDYAIVSIDGKPVAHLDRRLDRSSARIVSKQSRATLEILVENCGRINYGPDLPFERKGITTRVTLGERELRGWRIYPLPLDDLRALRFERRLRPGVAIYRGTFELREPADTFVDVGDLGKGVLWINGHNAGRFWNIGPQQTLYVPGVWMRPGENEAVVLDLFTRDRPPRLRGCTEARYLKEALLLAE